MKLPTLSKAGSTLTSWLFAFGVLVLSGLVALIGCGIAGALVIFAVFLVKPKED